MIFCKKCGYILNNEDLVCPNCGEKVLTETVNKVNVAVEKVDLVDVKSNGNINPVNDNELKHEEDINNINNYKKTTTETIEVESDPVVDAYINSILGTDENDNIDDDIAEEENSFINIKINTHIEEEKIINEYKNNMSNSSTIEEIKNSQPKKESIRQTPATKFKKCIKCGEDIPLDYPICVFCGANQVVDYKYCRKCGKRIKKEYNICPYCGGSQMVPKDKENPSNPNYSSNINVTNKSYTVATPNNIEYKYCEHCGKKINKDANVCKYCNGRQDVDEDKITNRRIALVVILFVIVIIIIYAIFSSI